MIYYTSSSVLRFLALLSPLVITRRVIKCDSRGKIEIYPWRWCQPHSGQTFAVITHRPAQIMSDDVLFAREGGAIIHAAIDDAQSTTLASSRAVSPAPCSSVGISKSHSRQRGRTALHLLDESRRSCSYCILSYKIMFK